MGESVPARRRELPPLLRGKLPGPRTTAGFVILSVTVAVTSRLFSEWAAPICLSTLIVAALFLRFARPVKSSRGLLLYCLIGGIVGGWGNAVLSFVSVMIFTGEPRMLFGVVLAALFGFIGALWGLPYGVSYYAPLWFEHKYRNDRLVEARERVMLLCGAWGVSTLFFVRWLTTDGRFTFDRQSLNDGITPLMDPHVLWLLALCASLGVMASGAVRLAALRLWISRVRQGRVPGWRVCPADEFAMHLVETLPQLSAPWWPRAQAPETLEVMARGHAKSAYRSQPLDPVYRVR